MPKRKRQVKLPRIGPCRDPLELWFLEFVHQGQVVRTYHEDRKAAGQALKGLRAKLLTPAQERILAAVKARAGADGWADLTAVYEAWDREALNMPLQFVGRAFVRCYASLKRRNLIEDGQDGKVRVR